MRSFLFVFLTLISPSLLAQIQVENSIQKIEVGKVKRGGMLVAELSYHLDEDKDTVYHFLFRNYQYSVGDFHSIIFNSEGGTLAQLYKICSSVFLDENKRKKGYKVNFKLGETSVEVAGQKDFGLTTIYFYADNAWFNLTNKELNRLFGKLKN